MSLIGDTLPGQSQHGVATVTLVIPAAPPFIVPTTLANATPGVAYSQTLSAAGGQTPYTWSVASAGGLPGGLSINATTGVISGTPAGTAYGRIPVIIVVTDALGTTATRLLSIYVQWAGTPLAISFGGIETTTTETTTTADIAYVTGCVSGPEARTWGGIDTQTGAVDLIVVAMARAWPPYVDEDNALFDSLGNTYVFAGAVTTGDTYASRMGVWYCSSPLLSTNHTWTSRYPDSSPQGIVACFKGSKANPFDRIVIGVNSTETTFLAGAITPSAASAVLSIIATNQVTPSVSAPFTIVQQQAPGFAVNALAAAWFSTSATLNPTWTVEHQGWDGAYSVIGFNISFLSDLTTTTTTTTTPGTGGAAEATGMVGNPFSQAVNAVGGLPSYNWSAFGSLPPGLGLSSDGILGGVPRNYGIYTFTLQVADATGINVASAQFVIAVSPVLTAVPTPLPEALIGQPYSATLTASGGTPTYNWRILSGALPPGLALDPNTGIISGTPAALDNLPITFEVTDSA